MKRFSIADCPCLPPQRGRRGLRIEGPTIFILVLSLGVLTAPLPSDAQQPGKVYRIGFLGSDLSTPEDTNPMRCPMTGSPAWRAFVEGLRERGYIPGQNLVIACRYTQGREERALALVADLMNLKVDLLVAVGANQVRVAKRATSTLPIVMVAVANPLGRGLVASLARPGGNVTGPTDTVGVEIGGKYVQLLKEAVPTVSRVAVLDYYGDPLTPSGGLRTAAEATARALGVTLLPFQVHDHKEIEIAFAWMTTARVEALLTLASPNFLGHEQRLVDLAIQSRLPAVFPGREYVEAGGLMSYGVNTRDIYRRIGFYVDRIFKGANPGDLPVEQPTKLELLINGKTAKALGLTIPQSLRLLADEVIE